MSWETWGPPTIVLLIGLVVGLLMALRARGGPIPVVQGEREALLARKDMLLEQLRAMEADRNKLDPQEFSARREALIGEAALVLRNLEELGSAPAVQASTPTAPASMPAASMPAAPVARPARAGRRIAWGLATVGFFVLLGAGLSRFSNPRNPGEPVTGGSGTMDGTETTPQLTPEVQAAMDKLANDPDNLDALNTITYDALLKRDLETAMRHIETARQIAPSDPGVLTHLAILQMSVGMTDRAITALDQATAARPDWGRPHLWKGLVLLQMGQVEPSIVSIEEALRLGLRADETRFAQEILAQARNPAMQVAPPTATDVPAGDASDVAPSSAGAEARVQGTVRLADGLSARPGQTIFLIAQRNAEGGGPPVAALRLSAEQMPAVFALSDANMMMGGTWPEQVWLKARLDADGAAGASEGDIESAVVGPLSPGSEGVALVIGGK